jgi:hypothetical protein
MSVSINSAAAKNERIAMSPRVGFNIWPEASLLAISPAPTVAVLASSPFFIKERRFAGGFNLSVTKSFKVVLLIRASGQERGIEMYLSLSKNTRLSTAFVGVGKRFYNSFTVSLNRSYMPAS